ncbi:MAG: glycoside hydrolase family 9 protein [Prolixibacteraceae bacterium]|jgi:endoglucanase|nr:glycoside hydrolase family 9 protein [Prolixibacteraceae bacterium]
MSFKRLVFIAILLLVSFCSIAQELSTDIRLNQLGYLPNSVKLAVVVNAKIDSFKVMNADLSEIVFKGELLPSKYYSASDENVRIADFTLMTEPGNYVLVIDGQGKSFPFEVSKDVLTNLAKATLKYYYFNRASMPIVSEFGGVWAREAGHPDTEVVVLPSAATTKRPAGTKISTPGGWYDAGDYNKYIISSAIPVFTLLSAYETYPELYDSLGLNIPESKNNIPDILDEALYNIRWMMTMQDEDGGIYNKTTEANFSGFDMPSNVKSTRYVCAKSTAASLDFAAVMAITSRVFKKFNPELADSALNMAIKAWQWAKNNPNVAFKNPSASGGYPGVNTGDYADTGFDDEFTWCATELYITTKDEAYYNEINFDISFGVPGYPTVGSLSLLSLLVNKDSLTEVANLDLIKSKFNSAVSGIKNNISTSPYRIPGDFYYWGGNNAFANWGMMFMQAFRLTGDASYFNAGLFTLDYLLGKNATTYCFVTGFGSKSPINPHHRISVADGVVDPVPGMLVGGAASGDGADCGANAYPSNTLAKSYLDQVCSYSTNEVAIGYNSGLVFLTGALIAEYQKNFTNSMPLFFSISKNNINLTNKKADAVSVLLEGNTHWKLTINVDWITISQTEGNGNATVNINSNFDNPTEAERSGTIYVYSQDVLTDSIKVTQNGIRKNFRIEAEDYLEKSGTQNETTGDVGGGENVGYVGIGNWLTYSLDISVSGFYNFTIRHAGYAGNFDVYINDVFLKKITFPKTADWQVYDSYTAELELTEGQHVMKLLFNSEGTNLNWYEFEWIDKTGISSQSLSEINIYPNPAKQFINIDFGTNIGEGEIQLLTVDGKTIIQKKSSDLTPETINISTLQRGAYLVKVKFGTQTISKKVIIE